MILLGMYSYFVLTSLRPLSVPGTPPTVEYVLWTWVASMITEEIRQVRIIYTRSLCEVNLMGGRRAIGGVRVREVIDGGRVEEGV